MLELQNITKIFNKGTIDEKRLFENFSMSIENGQFISVVGSNGSGKTTILNMISGDVMPSAGKIILDGKDITHQKNYKRAEKIAQRVSESCDGNVPVNDDF